MKILPINNVQKLNITPKVLPYQPSFQGVRISANTQKTAHKTLGDLADLFLHNLEISKQKKSYTQINEQEALKEFIKLQKNDSNVAKLLLESGRRLTEATCEMFNLGRKLNKKELQAFELMLKAKGYTPEGHLLISPFITRYFGSEPPEKELDAVINSTAKLENIFKDYPIYDRASLNDACFVTMALLLQDPNSFPEEEMKRYVHANLALFDASLLDWASGEKDARNGILTLLENSPSKGVRTLLDDAYTLYEEPIIPDKNLLHKLELLNKEPVLEGLREILEETCSAEDLKNNLRNFKQLPKTTQDAIYDKTLGNIIINFKQYKQDGKITDYELTPDDYIKFTKILQSTSLLKHISDSAGLYNIPKMTEENEQLVKKNLKFFLDNPLLENLIHHTILRMLFNPNLEENLPLLKELILLKNKDLLHELELKCQNFNPEFVSTAKYFLEEPENICKIATYPNFNKEEIINNLFHIAKMQALTMKHPERFMNYDESVVSEEDIDNLKDISKCVLNSYDDYTNKEMFIPDTVEESFYELFGIFTEHLPILYSALANTDAEYINMILSKRTTAALHKYFNIDTWKYKTGETISNILRQGRTLDPKNIAIKLSGKQKDFLIQNLSMVTSEGFTSKIKEIIKKNSSQLKNNNFILDYNAFVEDYNTAIINELGMPSQKSLLDKWDKELLPLVLNRINDNDDLKLIFELLSNDNLKEYIHNPFTPHGASNLKTKKELEELSVNYQTWLTGIPSLNFKINDSTYSIGLLDKSEPNGLFMGNYTSCCTGIDRTFGGSTPTYLLNTTFNIIVIKDPNGKIAGMTRVFINNNNGTPEFIIDNTEFDTKLLNEPQASLEKPILKYIKDFANALTGNKMPIFISDEIDNIQPYKNNRVIQKSIKPVGEITKKVLYINCVHDLTDANRAHNVPVRKIGI